MHFQTLTLDVDTASHLPGTRGRFEGQIRFEAYALDHLYRTADHAEVQAFREKRPPRFCGS